MQAGGYTHNGIPKTDLLFQQVVHQHRSSHKNYMVYTLCSFPVTVSNDLDPPSTLHLTPDEPCIIQAVNSDETVRIACAKRFGLSTSTATLV